MNQDGLLSLIGDIYGAAADSDGWPAILTRLGDAFGAGDASLSAVSQTAVPWLVAPRSDPELLASYAAHYHPLNLFWRHASQLPVGTPAIDAMVVPRETLQASEFFNDWSKPQGYLHVMGAMQLARRLERVNMDRAIAADALDRSSQALIVVDSESRVLLANRAANALFGNGLTLAGGILMAGARGQTAELHRMVAGCSQEIPVAAGGSIAISRGPGRLALSLLVIPAKSQPGWLAGQKPCALIFATDPEAIAAPEMVFLQKQFGLTPAEAVLTSEILKGDGIKAAAHRIGIAVPTARTQLSSVLAKTGTNRQAELIRLVLNSDIRHLPE